MGNTQGMPEIEIYKAVERNDAASLRATLGNSAILHLQTGWVDKKGRNALSLAAHRDHFECARKLLECGANVHYMNPKPGVTGGTALHEATRNRHEATAELLLRYGASPFISNAAGRTCMDEAVLHGSGNLLRRYEQLATWSGTVAVKMKKLGGLSHVHKPRHLVVIPVTSCPDPKEACTEPTIKLQLWIFKNAHALAPLACVWLDGAQIIRSSPQDALLRLRPSHKSDVGPIATRYEQGLCLNLRIADATATSTTTLDQLESLVNATCPEAQQTPQARLPSLAPLPSFPAQPGLPMEPSTHTLPDFTHHPSVPMVSLSLGSGTQLGQSPSQAGFHETAPSAPLPSGHTLVTSPIAHLLLSAPAPAPATPGPMMRGLQQSVATRQHAHTTSGTHPPTELPGLPSRHGSNLSADCCTVIACAPSAPPLYVAGAKHSLVGGQEGASADEGLCVICLQSPREAGYLHGTSVHMCVCRNCCSHVAAGAPCPLCRQRVERVISVF